MTEATLFTQTELPAEITTRLMEKGSTPSKFRAACRKVAKALDLSYTVLDGVYTFYTTDQDFQVSASRNDDGTVSVYGVELNAEDN